MLPAGGQLWGKGSSDVLATFLSIVTNIHESHLRMKASVLVSPSQRERRGRRGRSLFRVQSGSRDHKAGPQVEVLLIQSRALAQGMELAHI